MNPQYIEDRINKALVGTDLKVWHTGGDNTFDVLRGDDAMPLHVVDHGSELELLREKAPLHYLFEGGARDFPGLAREIVAAVQRLVEEGVIEDTDSA